MGTSKGYGGPPNGLVPTWVDEPAPGPALPLGPPGMPPPTPPTGTPPPQPPIQPAAASGNVVGALSGARGNFTRFAGSGSRTNLANAVSQYVRTGTGGARQAARRMGSSRRAAAGILGVVRDTHRLGPSEALRRFNLTTLADRPAADVFLAILEFICPAGGSVDEALARQAMLDAINDLAVANAGAFDTQTPEQLREFFLDFISRSIEGQVIAALGHRAITLPDDVAAVENLQIQLHDFIVGLTRGAITPHLADLDKIEDSAVLPLVDQIYEAAFELLAASGEAAP